MTGNQTEHALELAEELVDDIELSRLDAGKILLKATRLARFTGAEETREWLSFELRGYDTSTLSHTYMDKTGRWIDKDSSRGYYNSLASIDALINQYQAELSSAQFGGISGQSALLVTNNIMKRRNSLLESILSCTRVRSKVLAMIHDFSSSAYYGMRFGERQENLFSDVRVRVDGKLGTVSGRAVEKIEAIYERLESGDPEAISHAMTSCRRLVDDFIDALFPALDESRDIDGHSLKLGQQNRLNRLTAYVAQKIDSDGRKNRIRREMSDVYERINKGIHGDVTAREAQYLFIHTYLLLGEVLDLQMDEPGNKSAASMREAD